jgi:serine phosphatase RsbU (regulator of sigma subunit)
VFFGVLNIRSGELQYSNGAHNAPYLLGKHQAASKSFL